MCQGRAADILVVCTGNVCRSALVERVLQPALIASYGEVAPRVLSAGTRALVDHRMDERAAAITTSMGGDPTNFHARRLTGEMVRAATLVLTAAREHRAAAVALEPRALRRAFTLREFAALLRDADVSGLPDEPGPRLTAVSVLARSRRSEVSTSHADDFDVIDPFHQSDAIYEEARLQIGTALSDLAPALGIEHLPGLARR